MSIKSVDVTHDHESQGMLDYSVVMCFSIYILTTDMTLADVRSEVKACQLQVQTLTKEFEQVKAELKESCQAMNSMSDAVQEFILAINSK